MHARRSEIARTLPYALKHVPEEHKTPQLSEVAVKQTPYALKHVPEQYKTPQLCLIAVQAFWSSE